MESVGWILLGIAILFAGFFGLNLFFRIKVVRSYRKLRRGGVEFAGSAIFSEEAMRQIKEQYPDHKADIEQFATYLRMSIWMASVFIVVTIIFGSVLMYYR